jgi:hypothetical protein
MCDIKIPETFLNDVLKISNLEIKITQCLLQDKKGIGVTTHWFFKTNESLKVAGQKHYTWWDAYTHQPSVKKYS